MNNIRSEINPLAEMVDDYTLRVWKSEKRTVKATTRDGRNLYLSESLPGYGGFGNNAASPLIVLDGRNARLVNPYNTIAPGMKSQALKYFEFLFED